MYTLYFDGASRSNPGPASYGGVIYDENNKEIATYKKYIGRHTNNVAEYLGCFHGVQACIQEGIKNVTIYGDSKLVRKPTKFMKYMLKKDKKTRLKSSCCFDVQERDSVYR